jgi:hypothetical protein
LACPISPDLSHNPHIIALLVRAFLRLKAAVMSDKNHKSTESVNAFSPAYMSQLTPFKTKVFQIPALEQDTYYDLRRSIATPDEGKRARLLKARI